MEDRKKELGKLRVRGYTYEDIGKRFNISRQRVFQILTSGAHPQISPARREQLKQANRRYYQKKRASYNNKKRERAQKSKEIVLTHYGNGKLACRRCGFHDIRALSIDHKNGKGKEHRRQISGMTFYNWLIESKFPEGYQTLCMNCQWIKREENKELYLNNLNIYSDGSRMSFVWDEPNHGLDTMCGPLQIEIYAFAGANASSFASFEICDIEVDKK